MQISNIYFRNKLSAEQRFILDKVSSTISLLIPHMTTVGKSGQIILSLLWTLSWFHTAAFLKRFLPPTVRSARWTLGGEAEYGRVHVGSKLYRLPFIEMNGGGELPRDNVTDPLSSKQLNINHKHYQTPLLVVFLHDKMLLTKSKRCQLLVLKLMLTLEANPDNNNSRQLKTKL